jgi:hypothetical protein
MGMCENCHEREASVFHIRSGEPIRHICQLCTRKLAHSEIRLTLNEDLRMYESPVEDIHDAGNVIYTPRPMPVQVWNHIQEAARIRERITLALAAEVRDRQTAERLADAVVKAMEEG